MIPTAYNKVAFLFLFGFLTFWVNICLALRQNVAFVGTEATFNRQRGVLTQVSAESKPSESNQSKNYFSDQLIRSLDLIPLLEGVARHTGTRRGTQALLALIKKDQATVQNNLLLSSVAGRQSSRQRRAVAASRGELFAAKNIQQKNRSRIPLTPIALSAKEARQEYQLVEEALLALQENDYGLSFPPLYGSESSPWDISTISNTDDDEWLTLTADEWTIEHILQAEQVIDTLMKVKKWASLEENETWLPNLSTIGQMIDKDELLPAIYNEIAGRVEIVRVRSLTDPNGKASFTFRLNGEKFPILDVLRKKEEKLLNKGGKALDREIIAIQNEIDDVQSQIRAGLAQSLISVSGVIDDGMDVLARLDVTFAKAAYGALLNGKIPRVSSEGMISVNGFVHPVLATNDGFSSYACPKESGRVVPIDLKLSSDDGDRTLLISGPNGGGKTLSMKSFGLVSILTKVGIPIPLSEEKGKPRVDFFDFLLVNLGDQQSVVDGESTWTATLNSCASIIEEVKCNITQSSQNSYLVLLDELGSGTDPEAGGAVAQAILEQLMEVPTCQIVATTHSPRLKALSYESSCFGCATVLLQDDECSEYKRPSFRLEYGLIGESYALGAASRCTPTLPEAVLKRASQLMTQTLEEGDSAGDYIRALTNSMEEQVERANKSRIEIEEGTRDTYRCRAAMMSLASSYENHLARLEQRLEDCYQKLKHQEEDELELVGETLRELRVVKKQILSQRELLKERGLKVLPSSYALRAGESVVVITEDGWDGTTVEVIADSSTDDTLAPTEVLVQPASSFLAWDNMFGEDDASSDPTVERKPLIFQRHELAIWDYDSVWEDDAAMTSSATSVPDSKRKLNSLLSSLNSNSSPTNERTGEKKPKTKKSFLSARARKAASKGKGKKKR